MILLNGRGQLGTLLSTLNKGSIDRNIIVYHTWNFLDKSKLIQDELYRKFLSVVKKYSGYKMIFVSTKSDADNFYVKRKRNALILRILNGIKVVRIPNLLGKGICTKLLKNLVKPFGSILLMTVKDCAIQILKVAYFFLLFKDDIININGLKISCQLLKQIMDFSNENNNNSGN